jgi:hypothetical protein
MRPRNATESWCQPISLHRSASTKRRSCVENVLVESSCRKQTLKRGGDRERISLDALQIVALHRRPDLLALHAALERLANDHPEIARLVSLTCFAGLTIEQTSQALGISHRTAELLNATGLTPRRGCWRRFAGQSCALPIRNSGCYACLWCGPKRRKNYPVTPHRI